MSNGTNITTAELLSHYAKKEPRAFRQFDGFLDCWGDDVMHADDDGDALMGRATWELMNTEVGIRVLVPIGTTSADALRLLRKIINWIERGGGVENVVPVEEVTR
jgi:hypothetical protein